jgi:hypothetical protein
MPDLPKLAKPVRKARDVEPGRSRRIRDLPDNAGPILRFIVATGCGRPRRAPSNGSTFRIDQNLCVLSEHKTADATEKSAESC